MRRLQRISLALCGALLAATAAAQAPPAPSVASTDIYVPAVPLENCRVYIKGEPGTTFSYEEYPDDVANTIDPAQVASKAE